MLEKITTTVCATNNFISHYCADWRNRTGETRRPIQALPPQLDYHLTRSRYNRTVQGQTTAPRRDCCHQRSCIWVSNDPFENARLLEEVSNQWRVSSYFQACSGLLVLWAKWQNSYWWMEKGDQWTSTEYTTCHKCLPDVRIPIPLALTSQTTEISERWQKKKATFHDKWQSWWYTRYAYSKLIRGFGNLNGFTTRDVPGSSTQRRA